MLDLFAIFSKSGIVLFAAVNQSIIKNFNDYLNRLIRNVILEDRLQKLQIDTLLLQFYLDNEFDLVYIVGYQKMLKLLYIDKFLTDIQLAFRDRYKNFNKKNLHWIFSNNNQQISKKKKNINNEKLLYLDQSIIPIDTNLLIDFMDEFQSIYSQCNRYHQQNSNSIENNNVEMRTYEQSQKSKKTVASMIIQSKNQPQQQPKKQDKQDETTNKQKLFTDDEILKKLASKYGSPKSNKKISNNVNDNKKEKKIKKPTVWEFGGKNIDAVDLDFSKKDDVNGGFNDKLLRNNFNNENSNINVNDMKPDLEFSDNDDDDEEDVVVNNDNKTKFFGSIINKFSYNKILTKNDLDPILMNLREHLIAKNVAAEIAEKLCTSIEQKLIGQQISTWINLKQFVRQALEESILRILSPNRNINILREIQMKNSNNSNKSYNIVFCGVNGVGKSTNLAKIANWLLLNDKRILVIACDTFRAGAIEQLRTHIHALKNIHEKNSINGETKIDLYEKGYGKDATGIAMEGIRYANNNQYDVCLIDTAGRMQGNEPLMKQLAKLIKVNEPDLTLFVGEALVGNEAVDQLVNFNRSLLDNGCRSATNDSVSAINGIVLTKFDTIDDQVGAAISMTYITGQPIVFVGVGQTYRDLKQLNARAVVRALMK